jgi:hypothetical protein
LLWLLSPLRSPDAFQCTPVGQSPAKKAETELGRDIQKQTGAASVLVNRIVRQAATKRLQSKEVQAKKPN